MQTSSQSELKKELQFKNEEELAQLCVQLARHTKENKELLHYLLFEAQDEQGYILSVTEKLAPEFDELNLSNLYLAKKSIRRILKMLNKYIKFSGKKETEISLLLFFCKKVKEIHLPLQKNPVLLNLYRRQLQKINKTLGSLHEDLQYDYQHQLKELEIKDS